MLYAIAGYNLTLYRGIEYDQIKPAHLRMAFWAVSPAAVQDSSGCAVGLSLRTFRLYRDIWIFITVMLLFIHTWKDVTPNGGESNGNAKPKYTGSWDYIAPFSKN